MKQSPSGAPATILTVVGASALPQTIATATATALVFTAADLILGDPTLVPAGLNAIQIPRSGVWRVRCQVQWEAGSDATGVVLRARRNPGVPVTMLPANTQSLPAAVATAVLNQIVEGTLFIAGPTATGSSNAAAQVFFEVEQDSGGNLDVTAWSATIEEVAQS